MVGEHSLTTGFSAMLFDFRRRDPCVLDVPVTDEGPAEGLSWIIGPGASTVGLYLLVLSRSVTMYCSRFGIRSIYADADVWSGFLA